MTEEDYKLWAQMDPETLARFMNLGTLDERAALLGDEQAQGLQGVDYQLERAAALRRPSGTQYTVPVGAALGGLGDILRGVHGSILENRAMGERKALLDRTTGAQRELLGQKDRGRQDYAKGLSAALRARFGQKPVQVEVGMPTFEGRDTAVSDAGLLEPLIQEQTDHAGHGMLAKRNRPVGFGLSDLRSPFGFL